MAVFGRKVAKVHALAEDVRPRQHHDGGRKIIVPQKAYASNDPYDLVQSVVNFVNFALRTAYFNRDEIAENALRCYHVDYYLAQVKNGGHSQYAANSGMLDAVLRDVQQGLEAIGHVAASLHKRFLTFSMLEPARMEKVLAGGGFGEIDPFMDGLDNEFYAQDRLRPLTEANRDWLKTLPELQVVPDADYIAVTDAFAASNTQAEARKAERAELTQKADAEDPLKQAMTYLCLMASPPRHFIGWLQGQPGHTLGDGVQVIRFILDTDKGLCAAVFHPNTSLLFDEIEKGDPIAKVPTEMVTAHVQRETGQDLMAVLAR